jgi:hypothetical protein
MKQFKITIEGTKNIAEQMAGDAAMQRIATEAATSIQQFHNVLENRVEKLFNHPKKLSSVMRGRSLTPEKLTKSLLRFGLNYDDKPTMLHEYPVRLEGSTSRSAAPIRMSDGGIKWKWGQYSKVHKVAVRKGKYKEQRNKKGNAAFYHGGVLAARKRQTWHVRPTRKHKGTRTKTELLFGPSLAGLARNTFNQDPQVLRELDKMQERILAAYLRY